MVVVGIWCTPSHMMRHWGAEPEGLPDHLIEVEVNGWPVFDCTPLSAAWWERFH